VHNQLALSSPGCIIPYAMPSYCAQFISKKNLMTIRGQGLMLGIKEL